jgi:hypothetical protein
MSQQMVVTCNCQWLVPQNAFTCFYKGKHLLHTSWLLVYLSIVRGLNTNHTTVVVDHVQDLPYCTFRVRFLSRFAWDTDIVQFLFLLRVSRTNSENPQYSSYLGLDLFYTSPPRIKIIGSVLLIKLIRWRNFTLYYLDIHLFSISLSKNSAIVQQSVDWSTRSTRYKYELKYKVQICLSHILKPTHTWWGCDRNFLIGTCGKKSLLSATYILKVPLLFACWETTITDKKIW